MDEVKSMFKTVLSMVLVTAVAATIQTYVSEKVRRHVSKNDKDTKADSDDD